jgi:hypothetical protein
MGYLILTGALFVPGLLVLLVGKIPLTRRRSVNGSAARIVGAILMIPLLLYLIACRQSHVSPYGSDPASLDPLMPETEGFVRLSAMMASAVCLLMATVLAIIASEKQRR